MQSMWQVPPSLAVLHLASAQVVILPTSADCIRAGVLLQQKTYFGTDLFSNQIRQRMSGKLAFSWGLSAEASITEQKMSGMTLTFNNVVEADVNGQGWQETGNTTEYPFGTLGCSQQAARRFRCSYPTVSFCHVKQSTTLRYARWNPSLRWNKRAVLPKSSGIVYW